jgi:hypothetical protein
VHAQHECGARLVAAVVAAVPEDGLHQLVDRRDARAAGDEKYMWVLVGRPLVSAQGSDEAQGLARLKGVQVGACFAVWVALYEEV